VKVLDISENRIFFRDNVLGAGFGAPFINSKNLRRRKIERFTLADFSILRRNILTIWCFCSFICRKNVALATLQRI
jgi:hypothetical protein